MRYRTVAGFVLVLVCGLFAVAPSVGALEVPAAPTLERPIVDQTKTLSTEQIDSLSQQILTGRGEKDYQLALLIIPTLGNGEFIEDYSIEVARKWGIGDKDKDNGVLMLMVKDDRKFRIEVGRGLEGDLTDLESGRIVRDVISPKFKAGDYYGGLSAAIESIQAQVEGKTDPNAAAASEEMPFGEGIFAFIFFGLWIIPWFIAVLGRSKSWWLGGVVGAIAGGVVALIAGWAWFALIGWAALALFGFGFDYLISKNYKSTTSHEESPAWWAGGSYWGGSGGSGGSGGGFGGGGFGGGGASGDW
jgi:uncharacterized protein